MLVAVDEVRGAAEHLGEGRELHHQFGVDDFGIEPAQQARAQQLREGRKHAAIERLEMHRQGPERRGQGDVQADGATRTAGGGRLQRADFVAADRRPDHHHRCRVETAALDQIANGAVDAGAEAVIVGAQPDAARRGVAHSAAVLSFVLAPFSASARLSECSATK